MFCFVVFVSVFSLFALLCFFVFWDAFRPEGLGGDDGRSQEGPGCRAGAGRSEAKIVTGGEKNDMATVFYFFNRFLIGFLGVVQ